MERSEGPAIDNADSGITVAWQRSTENMKKNVLERENLKQRNGIGSN
jgi:hypothetical protein